MSDDIITIDIPSDSEETITLTPLTPWSLSTSTANLTFDEPRVSLAIDRGFVKIGETEFAIEHLEVMLKHLMKLTKDENPEEFL